MSLQTRPILHIKLLEIHLKQSSYETTKYAEEVDTYERVLGLTDGSLKVVGLGSKKEMFSKSGTETEEKLGIPATTLNRTPSI
jgi:hypothetical protein